MEAKSCCKLFLKTPRDTSLVHVHPRQRQEKLAAYLGGLSSKMSRRAPQKTMDLCATGTGQCSISRLCLRIIQSLLGTMQDVGATAILIRKRLWYIYIYMYIYICLCIYVCDPFSSLSSVHLPTCYVCVMHLLLIRWSESDWEQLIQVEHMGLLKCLAITTSTLKQSSMYKVFHEPMQNNASSP